MKYRKLFALAVAVFAVALSVPGCGKKKDENQVGPGGPANQIGNGFTSSGGYGQGSVLSLNTCYNVSQSSDGSVTFPLATDPANPHYVYGGQIYAIAYVASTVYSGGNAYSVQNQYGDSMTIYIAPNDQYFSGIVRLAPATVRDIARYLGKPANQALCIDGVVFYGTYIQGGRIEGGMTLYVNNYPVINF